MAQPVLSHYNRKRDFRLTPEPAGKAAARRGALRFVVQKHAASRLHYDFRLEWEGVLRSWAVPKGPSLDPSIKRMAVQVEDHPVSYGNFEGVIPEGQYGAGSVLLWDTGRWKPVGDAARGLREGKLKFTLDGHKLKGGYTLVRLKGSESERQPAWLLIKEKDEYARPAQQFDVLAEMAESVKGLGKAKRAAKAVPGKRAKRSAAPRRRRGNAGEPLPPLMAPQLATLVTSPPTHGEWLYELKLDGYRLLVRIDGDDVRCFTRNGNDWTDRMPAIVAAVKDLDLPPCWLDGELVALDDAGVPDFQRLQNAFEHHTRADLRYIAFDILFLDGTDVRGHPQRARSELLGKLLAEAKRRRSIIQFSAPLEGEPAKLLAASRAAGFEGLVGKRAEATYRSGRSRDWIKLKAGLRQEFVIGGFTDPMGSRTGLGSLLLGVHDAGGALRYVGNVGSGFDEKTLQALHAKLSSIESRESPFEDGPKRVGTKRLAVPHWVKPKLVAEVSFAGWTSDQHVRQAVFHGLREDKPARQITLERASQPAGEGEVRKASRKSKAGTAAKKAGTAAKVGKGRAVAKAVSATRRAAGSAKPAEAAVPSAAAKRAIAAPSGGRKAATERSKEPAPAGKRATTRASLPAGLRVTHPERVIDDTTGITKGDLVAYYARVAKLMLPHLADRPVAMLRAPSGIAGQKFFQKHADEGALPGVTRLPAELDPDHRPLLVIDDTAALLTVAQMNVVELHTWNATHHALEQPDRLIFDLDPGEGVEWAEVVEGTMLMRTLLDELGLKSFVKTSGGKGLHIVLPLKPKLGWDEAKEFSGDLVRHMSRVLPQRFVAKSGERNRVGRIFIDFLRNGRGATTVAAWSARSRPGMGISVPITWEELPGLTERPAWNVLDAANRLSIGNAPWRGYERARQSLDAAMKKFTAISRGASRR